MSPAGLAPSGAETHPTTVYDHHLFISRHKADERWVDEELPSRLRDARVDPGSRLQGALMAKSRLSQQAVDAGGRRAFPAPAAPTGEPSISRVAGKLGQGR
jgi:hypothetical protein